MKKIRLAIDLEIWIDTEQTEHEQLLDIRFDLQHMSKKYDSFVQMMRKVQE